MHERILPESETLEFKKSTSELEEALVSIAAILNKHGKGELLFGVKNDGTVVGQIVSPKTLRTISQAIAAHIEPRIYPKIIHENVSGKNTIRVHFEGGQPPYSCRGRAFMRTGDEDRQLSMHELGNLFSARQSHSWDNQMADCTLKDISPKAVKDFVKKANLAGRIDFKFQSAEATLKKLGLIRNGKPLRAAQALFSSKNPIKVQAALFAGTDKLTFLDIQQFENQNIFHLLKECEEYVKKHMKWRVKFGKLEREEIPEIPLDALREALVNSFCHRDYLAPESNKIAIFKNRIEIYNPGQFPAGLAPEDFIKKPEQSILRNPIIADGMYRTKDVEKWGSGLKRIHDACKENGVMVRFQRLKTGFAVDFMRDVTPQVTPQVQLSSLEQKIFDVVRKEPRISRTALSIKLKISADTVKEYLEKLKTKGAIRRVGMTRAGHWEVLRK